VRPKDQVKQGKVGISSGNEEINGARLTIVGGNFLDVA
jgi:hypothetical protein